MNPKVNIPQIMLPKVSTICICENSTVRQGMEIFQRHGYTAIPVVSEDGKYLGSVTEGDFWRHMCKIGTTDKKAMEDYSIRHIFRPDFCAPLSIDADLQSLIDVSLKQNFVPIIDDRGYLSGMVTRQNLIKYLASLTLES